MADNQPAIVGEEPLTPEQLQALGVAADNTAAPSDATAPQPVEEVPLTPEQLQALGANAPESVRPQDNPDAGLIYSQDWKPSPPQGFFGRIGRAIGSAFAGPYGVDEDELKYYTQTNNPVLNTVNQAVLGTGSKVADALLVRPPLAAVRGAAAAGAGLAQATGLVSPEDSNRMERDLNVMGEGALIESGMRPNIIKPPKDTSLSAATLEKAQKGLQWIADVDPQDAAIVRQLLDEGYKVSPAFAKRLPRLQRKVEMARKFGYDPTGESSNMLARNRAKELLVATGKTPDEAEGILNRLAGPSKPSMEESGNLLSAAASDTQARIQTKYETDLAVERKALQDEIDQARNAGVQAGTIKTNARENAIARLGREKAQSLAHANEAINDAWSALDSIRQSTPPGRLAVDFPAKLQEVRSNMQQQFTNMYNSALDIAGDNRISTSPIKSAVDEFSSKLPDPLIGTHKTLTDYLNKIQESGDVSLSELQGLRTYLRNMSGDPSMPPDFRKGPFKHFQNVVDDLIHTENAPASWKQAASELDYVDALYKKNMPIWHAQMAQSMLDRLKAGGDAAPDPASVARTLNVELEGPQRRQLLRLAGPEMRDKVASVTVDDLINRSKAPAAMGTDMRGPQLVDPQAFLKNVQQLDDAGALNDYFGRDSRSIVILARRLAQRNGDIALDVTQDGGFVRALQKAAQADAELQKQLKVDPAAVLRAEVEKAEKQVAEIEKRPSEVQMEENPIGFFLSHNRSAVAATESLLSPDNVGRLRTTVTHLGEDHPAIVMLREQALEKMLKPFLDVDPETLRVNPEHATAPYHALSETTQNLLFPGIPKDAIQKIGTEMRLIIGRQTGTAPSLAAGVVMGLPLPVAMPIMTAYEIMAWGATHPQVLKVLAGDLAAGGERAAAARARLNALGDNLQGMIMNRIGHMQAARSQEQIEPPGLSITASPQNTRPVPNDWQSRYGFPTAPTKGYATGGLVEASLPKTAEPAQDIKAQVDAVEDPNGTKDAVFIAAGSPLPENVPPNLIIVRRPEGHLLTTNIEKARLFQQTPQLTDREMADILDYTEPKSDVTDPTVMQGVSPDGGVSVEMLTSRGNEGPTADRIMEQDPNAMVRAMSPEDAQMRRAGYAAGGPVAPDDLMPHFIQASAQSGVPVDYLLRVAKQESGFNPRAVSPTGARGVMQVLPSTAAKPGYGMEGVDPNAMFDPAANIMFGAKYLAARANANTGGKMDWSNPEMVAAALRSYNGPVNAGGDPNYVNAIMGGGRGGGAPVQMAMNQSSLPSDEEIPQDDNLAMLMAAQPQDEAQTPDAQEAVDSIMPVVEAMIMSGNAKQAIALLVNAGLSLQEASKIVWSVKQSTSPRQLSSVA